jgi:hypothetical protein
LNPTRPRLQRWDACFKSRNRLNGFSNFDHRRGAGKPLLGSRGGSAIDFSLGSAIDLIALSCAERDRPTITCRGADPPRCASGCFTPGDYGILWRAWDGRNCHFLQDVEEPLSSSEINSSNEPNECSDLAGDGPKAKRSSLKRLPKSITGKTYSYARSPRRLHFAVVIPRCKRQRF